MEEQAAVSLINQNSGDRLGFGLFFAAAVHACLIFGLSLEVRKSNPPIHEMEVTLVTDYSQEAPVDADFWAQQNQEASGTEDEAKMLTSQANEVLSGDSDADGMENFESQLSVQTQGTMIASTVSASNEKANIDMEAIEEESSIQAEERARRDAIKARLDALRQDYARRPRVGTLTSVSAKARDDAAYQLHLQDRITATGNENYPAESLQQGLFGSLRLMLSIRQDGTLESLEILESSGELVLDQAALEIARASAPFQSFPPDTAMRYDKILFIRTWQFLPGGRLQTGE